MNEKEQQVRFLACSISTCSRTPTLTPTHLLWERGATPGFRDGEWTGGLGYWLSCSGTALICGATGTDPGLHDPFVRLWFSTSQLLHEAKQEVREQAARRPSPCASLRVHTGQPSSSPMMASFRLDSTGRIFFSTSSMGPGLCAIFSLRSSASLALFSFSCLAWREGSAEVSACGKGGEKEDSGVSGLCPGTPGHLPFLPGKGQTPAEPGRVGGPM